MSRRQHETQFGSSLVEIWEETHPDHVTYLRRHGTLIRIADRAAEDAAKHLSDILKREDNTMPVLDAFEAAVKLATTQHLRNVRLSHG